MKAIFCTIAVAFASAVIHAAPTKVGVLFKDRDLFWAAAAVGAQAAASEAGVELLLKAPLVPNSLAQQKAMLDALLKEELDVLVIAPLSPDAFKPQLTALAARGVKIVALDTELSDGLASTFVGYDQQAMADEAGRYFASLLKDGESAALLRAYSLEGMSVREKTLVSSFRSARPGATLHADIFAGSERQDDLAKSNLLLEKHPEVRAVCTPFSAATMAMTKAIQARGLAGKVLHVGFGTGLPDDIAAAIRGGAMQGWVAQQPKLIGRKAIEVAVQLAQGKSVPPVVDVPYAIVSKANLDDPSIQAIRD